MVNELGINEQPTASSAREVIETSITRAVGVFSSLEKRIRSVRTAQGHDPEVIDAATKNNCKRIGLLIALAAEKSGLFENIFIVEGSAGLNKPFTRANWYDHAYMILHAQGVWYFTSPANSGLAPKNEFAKIGTASDLKSAIAQISEYEGGVWPSSEQITTALKSFRRSKEPDSSNIPYIKQESFISEGKGPYISVDMPTESWSYVEMFCS